MRKILLISFVSFLVACGAKDDKPNVELVRNMMESPAIKAQDYDHKNPDKIAMRLPPENTIAIGKEPYPYKNQPNVAGEKLKNPYASEDEILARGQERYEIYCSVCHGPKGLGNGTVADKMLVKPPSMVSSKIKGWTDGRIYHVITDGQGLMGSYASQITKEDRWKIVNYIRQLQKEHKD